MKIIAPLLIFFIFSNTVFAQTDFRFADSTAQWNEYEFWYSFPPSEYTVEYMICGDTTFKGLNYQKICAISSSTYLLVRQDSLKQVFVTRPTDTAEYKIYDFEKNKGDTFYIAHISPYDTGKIGIHVDSVDIVFIGYPRKRMFVSAVENSYSNDIWIQGIGAVFTNLWVPGIRMEAFDGLGYNLLCYFENSQRLYHNDLFADTACDISTGINEITEQHLTILFPNPVSNNLINIQFSKTLSSKTTLQLFDLTGRMILQKPLAEKLNSVELPEIAKGMYLCNIISGDEKIYSGKLVVQ